MSFDSIEEPAVAAAMPETIEAAPSPGPTIPPVRISTVGALGLAAGLAACGGGDGMAAPGTASTAATASAGSAKPTEAEASRFLAQASMGATRGEIASVCSLGYAGWLDAQFALPTSGSRWDWLVAHGFDVIGYRYNDLGFDAAAWSRMLASPDTLRQRITFALSEIFVVGMAGLGGAGWPQFCGAAYLDLLESCAFGNHRDLLQKISSSPAMALFMTFRRSAKASPASGALPDENYARELMQLFTIGLVELDAGGMPTGSAANATPTYGLADITGLARVFTGWDFDLQGQPAATGTVAPDFMRRGLVQVPSFYETGAKAFLDTTIPAGTSAAQSLSTALDTLFAHRNAAPFFCRQLIQRLVTSNPTPAYVTRIAAVFADDGTGTRGNLHAVIRALLLDPEARTPPASSAATYGKLREPVLRLAGWARAWNVSSPTGAWMSNASDAVYGLAQSPLRSPSVFNFFRPGYVPPASAFADAGLVAPEFQITNETSVIGYVNFMQRAVAGMAGNLTPDYSSLLPLADDENALLAEINLVLAAGQIGAATIAKLAAALQPMAKGTDAARLNRIRAALTLALAAPEYIVQK